MQVVLRNDVQRLRDSGAALLEVLPPEEFALAHIPGAINIPLTELTAERARSEFELDQAVVVYCQDQL